MSTRATMNPARLVYFTPPAVLALWGGTFLYLAESGRLRVLLHPLFWPVEETGGALLLLMAAGYLFFFRPVERKVNGKVVRRILLHAAVLLVPFLAAVLVAPSSLSAAALERRAGLSGGKILAQAGSVSPTANHLELVDFAAAAYYPEHIPEVTGRKVSFLGEYFPGSGENEFRFCRVLMSCCASDATPIYLHVVGPAPKVPEMQWITIEGETFFRKDEGEWGTLRATEQSDDERASDRSLSLCCADENADAVASATTRRGESGRREY